MSKSITVPLDQVNFPPSCVVCLSPASGEFPVRQVYTAGTMSHHLTLNVPMCAVHHEVASHKGQAERTVGCLGVVGGALFGIVSVIFLLSRWEGGGGVFAKIFMGLLVGFGMFVLAWWIVADQLAPLFAVSKAKEARDAVQITLVRPFDKRMVLLFSNEAMAEFVEKMN
jgi:hypothetical protein